MAQQQRTSNRSGWRSNRAGGGSCPLPGNGPDLYHRRAQHAWRIRAGTRHASGRCSVVRFEELEDLAWEHNRKIKLFQHRRNTTTIDQLFDAELFSNNPFTMIISSAGSTGLDTCASKPAARAAFASFCEA